MTVNVRGVKTKLDSLESTLDTNDIHIAAITETHMGEQEMIYLDNYNCICKNRNKEGGGVAFLIRKDIDSITKRIEDLQIAKEILWIKVRAKKNIYMGCYYGQQENSNKEDVQAEYEHITKTIEKYQRNHNVILMGDFNAKLKIDKEECTQHQSRNGRFLRNMIKTLDLTIVNKLPEHKGTWTRINTKNQLQRSVIDYIITSKQLCHLITDSETDTNQTYQIKGKNPTNHNIIKMSLNLELKQKNETCKKWRKGTEAQWEQYNQELQQQLEKTDITNIGTLTTMIKKCLMNTIGRYTITAGRVKKNNNKNVNEAKERKVMLKKEYSKAIMSNNPTLIESTKNLYIASQKRHREAIEQANQDAIEKSIESITHNGNTDMNKFWKIRKNMLSKRQETYDTLDTDNQPITDPERAKEHIANYFEELYQAREGEEAYKQWTTHIETKVKEITQVTEQEENSTITMKELNTAIKALERGKATGPDEIPNEALIEANNTIRKKILRIFKRIYEKEETPDEWKEGTIIRIYKGKGTKGQCANERGITLSSNLGKLYERIINNKIQQIIEMTEAQGGGRRGAATVDHLKYINTYIQEMKKEKKRCIYYIPGRNKSL